MYSTFNTTVNRVAERINDRPAEQRVVGYWLNTGVAVEPLEAKYRLEDLCQKRGGHKLLSLHCEAGSPHNPMRMGLWTALRKMACFKCEPKKMPFSLINIEDFVTEALADCKCAQPDPLDGIVVTTSRHLCADQMKANQLFLLLAERGKHVIAEDGLCMSCCNPGTRAMVQKKKLLIPRST